MEINNCNNCLCHLKICKAECCKTFNVITPGEHSPDYKNQTVQFKIENITPDLVHYYKLHGCIVHGDIITFKCSSYDVIPLIGQTKIVFHKRCKALTTRNLCRLHNLGTQPLVCHTPNNKGEPIPGASVTPNCLYRGLYEKKEI
jgi:hypothetical protein